jgi:type II secretory pathway pseudopilin PulG
MKLLKQRGDTLVEVLLALAIISVTLGSSYALANKSQQAGRYAQERTEAQKIAETQLEKLKTLAPDSTKNIFDATKAFCLDTTLNRKDFSTMPPDSVDTDDFSTYPAECKSGFYNYAIKNLGAGDQFRVTVRWDRIGGGKDEVSMQYRAHYIDTANPLGPVNIPVPLPPLIPPASGSITSCAGQSTSSIQLGFTYANGSNVSLFRDDTLLKTSTSSPDTYINTGLSPGTTYTYKLRNGTSPSNTLLDTKACATQSAPPNIAKGKSAVDDSGCQSGYPPYVVGTPNNTIDGDLNTVWYTGNWCYRVKVDLGAAYNLSTIKADWIYYGHDYGWGYYIDSYTIEVSSNGSSWATISSGNSRLNTDTTTVSGTYNNVRYIRVAARSSQNWIGIYEIEAYQ